MFWYQDNAGFIEGVTEELESLMGIALNLSITLGSMAILMILILSVNEHGMFFHLFVSSHFFEQWFVVLLEEVFHFLVGCIPRYFIFVAIVNGNSFTIWLCLPGVSI